MKMIKETKAESEEKKAKWENLNFDKSNGSLIIARNFV
jgi:hypothetical protein